MATIINQAGTYLATTTIAFVGSAFNFALTGENWQTKIINNTGDGPNKFFLECADLNGAAIAEILQGKPPGGVATGQGQTHWISGNNGTSNLPQIDYVADNETGDIFKVKSVLSDSLIEIEYPGAIADATILSTPYGHYTKGVQVDKIDCIIKGSSTISMRMQNEGGTEIIIDSNQTLHFQEGSGPIAVYSVDNTSSFDVSFKKSLERLS
jgi:hypothetical protein